jgi:hypothetical protein
VAKTKSGSAVISAPAHARMRRPRRGQRRACGARPPRAATDSAAPPTRPVGPQQPLGAQNEPLDAQNGPPSRPGPAGRLVPAPSTRIPRAIFAVKRPARAHFKPFHNGKTLRTIHSYAYTTPKLLVAPLCRGVGRGPQRGGGHPPPRLRAAGVATAPRACPVVARVACPRRIAPPPPAATTRGRRRPCGPLQGHSARPFRNRKPLRIVHSYTRTMPTLLPRTLSPGVGPRVPLQRGGQESAATTLALGRAVRAVGAVSYFLPGSSCPGRSYCRCAWAAEGVPSSHHPLRRRAAGFARRPRPVCGPAPRLPRRRRGGVRAVEGRAAPLLCPFCSPLAPAFKARGRLHLAPGERCLAGLAQRSERVGKAQRLDEGSGEGRAEVGGPTEGFRG